MMNHPEASKLIESVGVDLLGKEHVAPLTKTLGAEDFGSFTEIATARCSHSARASRVTSASCIIRGLISMNALCYWDSDPRRNHFTIPARRKEK